MAAEVTEYQLSSGYCACCDAWTCASLPTDVAPHGFGPRLTAMVALLTGRYRLSKRSVQSLLWDVAGVRLATGSVCKLEQRMSTALEQPVDEALDFIRRQPVVHQDETGWRESRRLAWLWVTLTAQVTVFHVSKKRNAGVSKAILGPEYDGILVSDRHSLYSWKDPRLRQLCWSHLLRDFESMLEFPTTRLLGRLLVRQTKRLFRVWRRWRSGTGDRRQFLRSMKDVRAKIRRLLHRCVRTLPGSWGSRGRRLLLLDEALWNFVHVAGVEPTNNPAERAVRHAVIWRKTSFGTFGPRGTRFAERILSAVATLRQQGRNVLDFLVAAYAAALSGNRPPSLLPSVSP
jgi:transposase